MSTPETATCHRERLEYRTTEARETQSDEQMRVRDMAKPQPERRAQAGITRISVEGYKSLRTRQELDIRPLTVIAGINSSGKSSAIQPLLLLKQTIEAQYDPGPLLLDGPHVSLTSIEQVLSRTPISRGETEKTRSFTIGVALGSMGSLLTFGKDESNDIRVLRMSAWFPPSDETPITFFEGMTGDQFINELTSIGKGVHSLARTLLRKESSRVSIVRKGSFLALRFMEGQTTVDIPLTYGDGLEREMSRIIHLPALRGNPQRTYPTAAIEGRYPGTFEAYTAGVISAWQNRGETEKLTQLNADLKELGLTWKVQARKLDDTQVELLVGRLPHTRRGGPRDLVNIADVGFGVSQTLPVLVALLAADEGQLVYLEQPEIHLHPRAQVAFARLVKRAVDRGARVIVETHSSLFIRSVQTLVAQGELDNADVALHWFTRDPNTGDTQITSGELDESGAFGDWPEDFDEVYLDTEANYLDAAAKRTPRS
jgi:hypothetical protein